MFHRHVKNVLSRRVQRLMTYQKQNGGTTQYYNLIFSSKQSTRHKQQHIIINRRQLQFYSTLDSSFACLYLYYNKHEKVPVYLSLNRAKTIDRFN